MGRPLKIQKYGTNQGASGGAVPIDEGYPNFGSVTNPVFPATMTTSEFFGVVGGNDTVASATFPTVQVRVKIGSNAEANGYIIRQKGSIKYLVSDGTNSGVCTLCNEDDASLGANQMTITMADGDSTARRISKLTNKWALDYTGGSGYTADEVVQRIRWLATFFDDGSTAIKSGTNNQTVVTAALEDYT